jgi:hypothetical protein
MPAVVARRRVNGYPTGDPVNGVAAKGKGGSHLMIHRTVLRLVVAASLCMTLSAATSRAAEHPDATIEFNGGSAAAGVGVSWGAGVLKYKGRSYAFKVNGLSVGNVGVGKASASGEVFNLKKLEDFNGNYVAGGAGLAVAGGGAVAAMKNQNGVTMHVKATTQGAKVTLGGGGVGVELLQ